MRPQVLADDKGRMKRGFFTKKLIHSVPEFLQKKFLQRKTNYGPFYGLVSLIIYLEEKKIQNNSN